MASNNLPATYTAACKALDAARTFIEAKDFHDKADAMKVYALHAKDAVLMGKAIPIKKCAERRIGQLIEERRKAGKLAKGGGDQRSKHRVFKKRGDPTLAEQGIDVNLADRSRKAWRLDTEQFERLVAKLTRQAVAVLEGSKAVIREAREERHQEKKRRRVKREKELAAKITALPQKKYGVIYADPEWKFEVWSDRGLMNAGAENHYPTSELVKIKNRKVSTIAANDSVLFLWATVPMLPEALEVMEAWGFTYKTNFAWGKDKAGTGYWNRNKHELLLVGTRGKVPAPAEGEQWVSLILAPRGAHSEKPAVFRKMIEEYFPNLPKVELNYRGVPPEGWDVWGLEAEEKDIQSEAAQ